MFSNERREKERKIRKRKEELRKNRGRQKDKKGNMKRRKRKWKKEKCKKKDKVEDVFLEKYNFWYFDTPMSWTLQKLFLKEMASTWNMYRHVVR
jgi:hypothetical protein